MYACTHVIAAPSAGAVREILEGWLCAEGLRVARALEHGEAEYRRFRWLPLGLDEPPSLSLYALDAPAPGPCVVLEPRAERHPAWSFRLARALSAATGALALTAVEDRLQGDYGRAAYFAGRSLEALAAGGGRLAHRAGAAVTGGVGRLLASCEEDANHAAFERWLARLWGREAGRWWFGPAGRVTSLVLERPAEGRVAARFPDDAAEQPVCAIALEGLEGERLPPSLAELASGWRLGTAWRPAPEPIDWSVAGAGEPVPWTLLGRDSALDADALGRLAPELGRPLAAVGLEPSGVLRAFCWDARRGARRAEAAGLEAFLDAWWGLAPPAGLSPWALRVPP